MTFSCVISVVSCRSRVQWIRHASISEPIMSFILFLHVATNIRTFKVAIYWRYYYCWSSRDWWLCCWKKYKTSILKLLNHDVSTQDTTEGLFPGLKPRELRSVAPGGGWDSPVYLGCRVIIVCPWTIMGNMCGLCHFKDNFCIFW